MGYLSDLGNSTVEKICETTGYPMDSYGHLLDPRCPRNGELVKDWNKKGTNLFNLTSPYGHLHFAVGSGDDFICADYAMLDCSLKGNFIILDFTFNSETGCYIGGAGYHVLPVNTDEEKRNAISIALNSMDNLDIRHTKKGWNQDEMYFARCVAKALFPHEFKGFSYVTIKGKRHYVDYQLFSDREMRFGGKKINELFDELLTGSKK